MDLKQRYDELVNVFKYNIIQYSPYELQPYIKPFTLYYVTESIVEQYVAAKHFFLIVKKSDELETNFFKLISLKNELNEQGFISFLNTYLTELDKVLQLVNSYFENYKTDIKEYVDTDFNSIRLQNSQFTTHYHKIKLHIESPKESTASKKTSTSSLTNEVIPFRELLISDKKEEIEKIIITHFANLKGVSLRYLLEFLKDKGILMQSHGDGSKIYNSLQALFQDNNIGKYNSIFQIKKFTTTDQKYIEAKKSFEKAFENLV